MRTWERNIGKKESENVRRRKQESQVMKGQKNKLRIGKRWKRTEAIIWDEGGEGKGKWRGSREVTPERERWMIWERGERRQRQKGRQTFKMKAFQQTSTSVILAVAKAGISSGCTTAEVSGLMYVFDPQSSGLCRRCPRRSHTPRRKRDPVLSTGRQHGLQHATRESPNWPHG